MTMLAWLVVVLAVVVVLFIGFLAGFSRASNSSATYMGILLGILVVSLVILVLPTGWSRGNATMNNIALSGFVHTMVYLIGLNIGLMYLRESVSATPVKTVGSA